MGNYKLALKKSVSKDLRRLPHRDILRILKRIEALIVEPRHLACEKLSGQERYRVRQGRYPSFMRSSIPSIWFWLLKLGTAERFISNNKVCCPYGTSFGGVLVARLNTKVKMKEIANPGTIS